MTVYVDDMRMSARVGSIEARWSHLMCDGDPSELMVFAVRLGMRPEWLQKPGTAHEHFDLTDVKRDLALRLGARAIAYGREGVALVAAKRAGVAFDLDAFRSAHPTDETTEGQLDLF